MKENLIVSFSGGRTSAYMSYILKTKYSDKYNITFIFANTGQENTRTLDFVKECDNEWCLNVVWVEAVVNPVHGQGIRHKVVDFDTASRNGEPFEAFIAKSGIPNSNKPQCSDRLKALPIESYKKSTGLSGVKHCIGIRSDEASRKSEASIKKYNIVYPMCDWFESDLIDVNDFWELSPFDLGLKSYEGNCKTCWKKSDPKLFLIAKENPQHFDFFADMEHKYKDVKPNDNGQARVFFRKHRSAADVVAASKQFAIEDLERKALTTNEQESVCSESCNAYE